MKSSEQNQVNAGNGTRVMESETISKTGLVRNTQRNRRNFIGNLFAMAMIAMAIFTFASCEKEDPDDTDSSGVTDDGEVIINSDDGAVINGVRWATRNVDKPGSFVAKPENKGMLYQWNRNVGWSAENPLKNSNGGGDWDSSTPSGVAWIAANDPSPAGWRIPTQEELKTLLDKDNVTSEWTTLNRIPGRRFTDKATGVSIFLPAVGHRNNRGVLDYVGSKGNYWSSEQSDNGSAWYLNFYSEDVYMSWGVNFGISRSYGFSVRPVNMIVEVRNITLNKTSLTLQPDNTVTLIATVLPSNAMDKTVTWTSSNTSVATVDNSGVVTALSDGAADITAQAGSKTATCTVNVISETGIIINGVTWATRNVDAPGTFAASPESFGMLYQWNRNVGWSAENPLKNSDGGDDWDSSTPSGVAWIAANDPSPAGWHIPTQEELKTLLDKDNVTSEWTTLNRIPGRRFTDKNTGTSIFLPAVGLRDGYGTGALENAGSAGYYWSNEQSGSSRGYCMTFENNSVNMYASWRYYGFSVRPVKE